ncbi:DNA-binding HxlR family transcriptional regulator [Leucobacter exalbidus]|uniref:DNA-binding HxlR family transcriptional regulator n=1 Tax=Leucobacter exalbidus TaxID=662960 RepID=A0A940T3L4_9MICO|nr:helix-turn-helix domain-containing protein [Leucobacter exalbidus]MBP1325889.1 DNA-binding HxlR family transcriptional regulator [Leucobacter exalbidus]
MSNVEFGHIDEEECRRFQSAAELAGRKWNAAILMAGARGARRFSEYRTLVDGISDRLLAARLKELEFEGLIAREVQPTTPVSISYTLTTSGRQLISLLHPLVTWSQSRQRESIEPAAR